MAKSNKSYNRMAAQQSSSSKEYEKHVCRECGQVTPLTAFHTLTVKDRQPTLGRCPEQPHCVLLSQRACPAFVFPTKAAESTDAKEPGSV